jgi:endonuclease/exonuclease/phosphatase family metal-dependent hydrolase
MYQNIKTIRVGTFNLMNLMLPNKPLYRGTLFCSQEDYVRKAEWTDFMLTQMDADIIGFQELFHRNALVNIFKDNPLYRKAKLYMADEVGDQPRVALLSRFPVENIEVFTDFPKDAVIDFSPKGREYVVMPFTTFSRPVLRADVRIPDYGIITCFVIHLKSKRAILYDGEDEQNPVDLARGQSRSLIIRAAEAVAARALIAEAMRIPDRPVIVCGDVNDVGNAVTSRILTGEVPQHRLADQVKKQIWDVLLYHVKDIQARRSYQDFYYTHIHNGMYESLDHIMVSQELVTENPRNQGRVGQVCVYNDHLIDQTFTNDKQDKCKSDHGVVTCTIELNVDNKKVQPKGKYYH